MEKFTFHDMHLKQGTRNSYFIISVIEQTQEKIINLRD
jgi:hypothetical protein